MFHVLQRYTFDDEDNIPTVTGCQICHRSYGLWTCGRSWN